MAHSDLAAHFYERGCLEQALKFYVRSRDYGTTAKHTIDRCLNMIRISIEMNKLLNVPNWVTQIQKAIRPKSDLLTVSKV
jgi:COP9 signalosome complex subunit 1